MSSGVRHPRSSPEDVDDEGNQSAYGRHESTGEDETRSEIPQMDVNGVASSVGSETSPSEAIPTAIGSVFVNTRGKARKGGASLKSDTSMIGLSGSSEDSDKRRRVREQEA